MKRLTPKQRVRAVVPHARIVNWYYGQRFTVERGNTGTSIGSGNTIAEAWADAARRLEKRK